MDGVGTEALVLVALAEGEDEGASTAGRSLSSLVDVLTASSGRLSGSIELATVLEELRADGLIERRTADAERTERARFVLTAAGETRAETLRERLAADRIELVEGETRRELSLSAASAELDRSLVEIAADCTDDGVYYSEDEPSVDALVGRDAERERCRTVLERVNETGNGRAVFLTGPSGVGKTALFEEVLDSCPEEFATVPVRCRGSSEPFGPVRELLEAVDSAASPFADVGSLADEIDDHEDYRAQQSALFYDVTEALAPGTDEPPRVIAFDDLHLADAGTMAYLEFLLDRLAEYPITLVGTYRPEALSEDAPVAADRMDPDVPVTHLRLDSLDREATRGVIERVLDRRGAPDDLVAAVHERTGGNPLFVEETVSRLLETDQLDPRYEWYPDDPDEIDVPEAVRGTIDQRVDALEPAARELLRWAAVIGESVPVGVLERVCDLPPSRFETLLEALVTAAVFERRGDGRTLSFRSEVVRDAIVSDLDAADRRERHDAVAAALEADADEGRGRDETTENQAAAIAAHHERAGNDDRAIEWYRRAGQRATDVYAHDAAVEHYDSALAIARESGDERTLLETAERLAEIYLTTGDFDRAERHVRFVRERSDDVDRIQRMALLSSRIANDRGDWESAAERASEGLELEDSPSETRCRLRYEQASAHRDLGEFDRATEAARRQREEARAIDDSSLEARAPLQLGIIEWKRGEYDAAREHLHDALEAFRPDGDRKAIARTKNQLGAVAWSRGEFEDAREFYTDALEEFQAVGSPHSIATVRMNLGLVATDRGDYERARESYRRSIEQGERVGATHTVAFCRVNLGVTLHEQGAYEAARENYRDSLEVFREIGDRRFVARTRIGLGHLAIDRGAYQRARNHLQEGLEIAREVGDRRSVALADLFRGKEALASGDLERARERFDDALEDAREMDARHLVARSRLHLGEVALAAGRTTAADEHLHESLAAYESMESPRLESVCRTVLGTLAIEQGEYETASERIELALETLEDLDVRDDAARARRALGRVAAATGDAETAAERWRVALETFEEIGAAPDALETLELLVDHRLEWGDGDVRELLERAAGILEDCEGDLESHRERISEYQSSLEDWTEVRE